jgi:hypothetical protein
MRAIAAVIAQTHVRSLELPELDNGDYAFDFAILGKSAITVLACRNTEG